MDKQLNPATSLVKDKTVIVAEQKKQLLQGFIILTPGLSLWQYDLNEELTEDNIHKVELRKQGGTVTLSSLSSAEVANTHYTIDNPKPGLLYDQAINKKNALKKFNRQIEKIVSDFRKRQ